MNKNAVAILTAGTLVLGSTAYIAIDQPFSDPSNPLGRALGAQEPYEPVFRDPVPFDASKDKDKKVEAEKIPTPPKKGEKAKPLAQEDMEARGEVVGPPPVVKITTPGTAKGSQKKAPEASPEPVYAPETEFETLGERGDTVNEDEKGNPIANPTPPARTSTSKMPKNSIAVPRLKSVTTINTSYGDVKNGSLTMPNSIEYALYHYGAQLKDTRGTITAASHVNYKKTPGPLKNSWKLKKGDFTYTKDAKGNVRAWKLNKVTVLKKQALPREIFTRKGENRLVLVTCGGKLYNTPEGRHFDSNVILYFTPAYRK